MPTWCRNTKALQAADHTALQPPVLGLPVPINCWEDPALPGYSKEFALKKGRMTAYISLLDLQRVFHRILKRSGLPV